MKVFLAWLLCSFLNPQSSLAFTSHHYGNSLSYGAGSVQQYHAPNQHSPLAFSPSRQHQQQRQAPMQQQLPHLTVGRSVQKNQRSRSSRMAIFGTIELADCFYDDTSLAFDAWEWTNAIGAPAALVAGAVLVTLSDTREESAPRKTDLPYVRLLKRTMRFLLLTAFVLEVVSIFAGTMTGSVLLAHGPAKKLVGYQSPLQLLHHHHEFEYLTTQICFLQGLLNWLAAVAVELIMPRKSETTSAKRLNRCMAGWLISFLLWMLAFYNNHLSFYSDYATMLKRFGALFFKRFILATPFRPMSLLYGPSFLVSSFLTWRAFKSPPEEDDD